MAKPKNIAKTTPAATQHDTAATVKEADQIFTPRYKTEDAMLKALAGIVSAEASVRDTIQDVIVSALAHHEECKDKGGSVQTTLTKVYNQILTFKSVNQRMILNFLKAVLGPNLTYKEEKGKGGMLTSKMVDKKKTKLVFNAIIKQEAGEYHYSERKFWQLDINAAELKPWSFIARLESLLATFENPDKQAMLGKDTKADYDYTTEADTAIAVRELLGLMKPNPDKAEIDKSAVKELTVFASKVKAQPTILHDVATRH